MNPDAAKNVETLTRTRLLARNTLFNLLGQVAPLIAAILAIPLLIKGLGTDRFGVLTLAWMVLGYFGLFDLGLGRAMTKLLGEKLGEQSEKDIPAVFWTGMLFMLLVGVVSMLIVLTIAHSLVYRILNIPLALRQESLRAFVILGLSVPIVTTTSGLRGALEAFQKFGHINIVRTVNGLLTFLAPLAVLQFSTSLKDIIIVLALGRAFIWAIYYLMGRQAIPVLARGPVVNFSLVRPLFRLGGWMSVSNIIGPVMVYFDRFLIGAWLSVAAVAYYVTPYEVVTKLMLVTAAVTRVLFPAFSVSYGVDNKRTAQLYSRGIRVVFLTLFPITLLVVIFAHPAMKLWLGADFANRGAVVMQWLAIGVLLNTPGQIAFALIQAAGRPDLTGKLHIVELPLYLFTLWIMVMHFGIKGAAMAWTLRMLLDSIILLLFVHFVLKHRGVIFMHILIAFAAAGVTMMFAMIFSASILMPGYSVIAFAGMLFLAWKYFLQPDEKNRIRQFVFRKESVSGQVS